MKTILVNDVPLQIVRSARRKTMAIKIIKGEVSVHIPQLLPLWLAKRFVNSKQHWIQSKLEEARLRTPARKYLNNEMQPFKGNFYPLTVNQQSDLKRIQLDWDQQTFKVLSPISLSEDKIRQTMINWYRRQADSYLTKRTQELAAQTGLQPQFVQIKSYKARWGSCNARGEIQLNWQLIQAAPSIIDYVIIHELCHLQHHNHSKQFWALVEQFDPNYREHRAWLKQNGLQLLL